MTRKTVLIVDDDQMTLQLTTQVIERFGWEAVTADSGAEALDVLGERGPEIDLVLLDLAMPRMDGFAVAETVRKDPQFQDLPILALTARVEFETQQRALQSGIDGIIYKPFEVEKFRRTLEQHLA